MRFFNKIKYRLIPLIKSLSVFCRHVVRAFLAVLNKISHKILTIILTLLNVSPTSEKPFRRVVGKTAAAVTLSAAALSLIYWVICLVRAGSGIAELWIWPAASVFFIICYLWVTGRPPFTRLHKQKWLRICAAVLLVLIIGFFGTVECLIISGMDDDGEPGLDYIIVLGAQVKGTRPSLALSWRINRAYEYLTENFDTIAVVSGGQGAGEDISEAECMKRELVSRGITEERILMEDKSSSTKENITFSLLIIGSADAEIGIVTNNFHVWRAVKIAHRAGADNAVGIAAPFRNPLIFHYMAREFFSTVMNSINGNM
jgi:uncharacterized SAM-binding protein YcdF (DUF218 family)